MLTETFSASNVAAVPNNTGFYAANTTSFSLFDTSLGTLNSISLTLTGTATYLGTMNVDIFADIVPASNPGNGLMFTERGSSSSGSFTISATGQDSSPFDLAFFQGTGTQALSLYFNRSTDVNNASGSLTYNYTPAAPVAVTPEPSSLALLGTGILGVAGVVRKRLA